MNDSLCPRTPFLVVCVALSALMLVPSASADAQARRDPRRPEVNRLALPDAAKPETAAADAAAAEEAPPTAPQGGLLRRVVRFIRSNGVWIIGALVVALAAVGYWALRGGGDDDDDGETRTATRGSERSASGRRYSSTRISASDVNDRVEKSSVEESEVETDREYALVVDEDALKMPPLPDEVVDEHTGRQYAESGDIRKLLEASRFGDAYDRYVQRIERDTSLEFHSQLEQTLSEYFLRKREFDKVARILEHHVATHAEGDIDAQIWFNLGYAHVFRRQGAKSRRYFERFCEKETDPKRVARARRLIEQITRLGPNS